MLEDMVLDLIHADTPKAKERAYRALEWIGVDRMTARVMAADVARREKAAGK